MNDQIVANAAEMPKYKSHKEVWALEIEVVSEPLEDGSRYVHFKDTRYSPALCPLEMFARYVPTDGDFYVCYRDDYRSFSPKREFLDGYSLIGLPPYRP